jgi:hypothetical protein
VSGSDHRSYAGARSYARVARSSSTDSLEEGPVATRRWTADETRARVAAAPPFRHPSPDEPTLQSLVLGYEAITRDPVRRLGKRNLIAAAYRLQGPGLLDRARTWFIKTGTHTNLLGILRTTAPETLDMLKSEGQPAVDATQPTAPDDLLPSLTYGADRPPPFGADPRRRYDRRPSNPDASSFFTEDELGDSRRQSPTSRALDR